MAHNPVPAITYILLWTTYLALVLSDESTLPSVPACDDLSDIITGCGNTISSILGIVLLGTIPGAPLPVNAVFAVAGVISRISIIWSILTLVRGN